MFTQDRVDLHTHTAASDGTGTLSDLIAAAVAEDIAIVAVTDHDTLESAVEAYAYMRFLAETGDDESVKVIPGVELTSQIDVDGKAQMVHIIGLGIRPFSKPLVDQCEHQRICRHNELLKRLEFARWRGYGLSAEAEARVMRDAFWGKGEIARELVIAKLFDTVDSAYKTLWKDYGKSSELEFVTDAAASIDVIHEAGGLAVLAHPFRNENLGGFLTKEEVIAHLDLLVAHGLDAAEAFYRTCSPEDAMWLEGEATARGLAISVGSDHHDHLPHMPRYRLGKTASDGNNYGAHATVLDLLSFR